jgi:hypothetical protein
MLAASSLQAEFNEGGGADGGRGSETGGGLLSAGSRTSQQHKARAGSRLAAQQRYHHPVDTRAKYRMHRHYGPHEGGSNHDKRTNPHHHMILD